MFRKRKLRKFMIAVMAASVIAGPAQGQNSAADWLSWGKQQIQEQTGIDVDETAEAARMQALEVTKKTVGFTARKCDEYSTQLSKYAQDNVTNNDIILTLDAIKKWVIPFIDVSVTKAREVLKWEMDDSFKVPVLKFIEVLEDVKPTIEATINKMIIKVGTGDSIGDDIQVLEREFKRLCEALQEFSES